MHRTIVSDLPKSSDMTTKTSAQLRSKCQPGKSRYRHTAPINVSLQCPGFLPASGICQNPMLSCSAGGQPCFPQDLRPLQVSSHSCPSVQLQKHGVKNSSLDSATDQLAV